MLVKERMSHPVITIRPETTMQEALGVMRREHVRRLPVIDKHGELVGIVTDADLDKASPSDATTLSVWEIRDLISKVRVDRIMASQVITIDDETPIEEAARIMADSKISGLPVLHEGKLVGLITETDLFKVFLELFGAREHGVRLTVEVPRGPGSIAKLTRSIFEMGGDIVSLGTYMGENSQTGRIILKVEGIECEDLVEAVTPLVSSIIDVRQNMPN